MVDGGVDGDGRADDDLGQRTGPTRLA